MLQNADRATLTVRQIAAHLNTASGTITRELLLAARGQPGRLRGEKKTGAGRRGRGGQWCVRREVYLDWLGIHHDDLTHLGPDGLPALWDETAAARELDIAPEWLRNILLDQAFPHVAVGWRRYLTHSQLDRLRTLLPPDYRDDTR